MAFLIAITLLAPPIAPKPVPNGKEIVIDVRWADIVEAYDPTIDAFVWAIEITLADHPAKMHLPGTRKELGQVFSLFNPGRVRVVQDQKTGIVRRVVGREP